MHQSSYDKMTLFKEKYLSEKLNERLKIIVINDPYCWKQIESNSADVVISETILRIGQFEPSSKLCNVCGYHNSELTLKDREWTCPNCKTPHDRDINAAINIIKFSLLDQNLITI